MIKIIIAGSSKAGKSTFAAKKSAQLGIQVISTDSYINKFSWEDAPKAIIEDIKDLASYILEGINCGRILRTANKLGIDLGIDEVYYLSDEHIPLNKGQLAQKKGCQTIWADVVPILDAAGIDVKYGVDN